MKEKTKVKMDAYGNSPIFNNAPNPAYQFKSLEISLKIKELVTKNFCKQKAVVSCPYIDKRWCPKTCGIYIRAKFWNR